VTLDRVSGLSLGISLGLHALLLMALGTWIIATTLPASTPMLIEVTLAGTNPPQRSTEGQKSDGAIIAPHGQPETKKLENVSDTYRRQLKQKLIQELAKTRSQVKIGVSTKELRETSNGLAEGRGAGEYGLPGSPQGTLSLSGTIATRGFKEPDFSVLKNFISEETQLRLELIVGPDGTVKQSRLFETSGFPYVDQKALELSRAIRFDPLPANWPMVDQSGILTIKLKL
jgi:TonB family protein